MYPGYTQTDKQTDGTDFIQSTAYAGGKNTHTYLPNPLGWILHLCEQPLWQCWCIFSGAWVWSDGSPSLYTKWAAGEPKGPMLGPDRDCTSMTKTLVWVSWEMRWYNRLCDHGAATGKISLHGIYGMWSKETICPLVSICRSVCFCGLTGWVCNWFNSISIRMQFKQAHSDLMFSELSLLRVQQASIASQSFSRSITNSDFRKCEILSLDFSNTNHMEYASRVIEGLWYNLFHQQLQIKISHWNCM